MADVHNTASAHTPGPWCYSTRGDPNAYHHFYIWDDATIAEVHFNSLFTYPKERAEANVRLIVAAPDLYDACNSVLEHRDCCCQGEDFTCSWCQCAAAVRKAKRIKMYESEVEE